jgi:hypothetical protein
LALLVRSRQHEPETQRIDILQRVDTGEINTLEASKQLGVTRARVNQLLRRRRLETLTR